MKLSGKGFSTRSLGKLKDARIGFIPKEWPFEPPNTSYGEISA